MNVSFGWTWPAFVAGEKTCTRRNWKNRYALGCKEHVEHVAYDQQARCGGKPIGVFTLTESVVKESTIKMPFDDYRKEGFFYLNKHRKLIPGSSPLNFSLDDFEEWREENKKLWVIRFDPIIIFQGAINRLESLKREHGYQ